MYRFAVTFINVKSEIIILLLIKILLILFHIPNMIYIEIIIFIILSQFKGGEIQRVHWLKAL